MMDPCIICPASRIQIPMDLNTYAGGHLPPPTDKEKTWVQLAVDLARRYPRKPCMLDITHKQPYISRRAPRAKMGVWASKETADDVDPYRLRCLVPVIEFIRGHPWLTHQTTEPAVNVTALGRDRAWVWRWRGALQTAETMYTHGDPRVIDGWAELDVDTAKAELLAARVSASVMRRAYTRAYESLKRRAADPESAEVEAAAHARALSLAVDTLYGGWAEGRAEAVAPHDSLYVGVVRQWRRATVDGDVEDARVVCSRLAEVEMILDVLIARLLQRIRELEVPPETGDGDVGVSVSSVSSVATEDLSDSGPIQRL